MGRIPLCTRSATIGLAVLLSLWTTDDATAQWPPDSLTNLQVLPEDMAFRDLMDTMAGFTRALGVRCSHCHVGEEGARLSTYDFAADDKALKTKAREMLRMVRAINDLHLAGLEERSAPPVAVECFTCHRGTRAPRTLQAELRMAYDSGGVDALVARYHGLREEYYGRASYDFGAVPLADLGGELQQAGALADAETVHALNVEMNPGEWFPQRQHASTALLNAFMESAEEGRALYHRLAAVYDSRALSEAVVNQVGYGLLPQDADAAVAVFRLNAEIHPDSWNAHDSLGEGLERLGDPTAAARHYRRSIELNPENANARDRLAELEGGGP
jgi:tetratricopeptide (TPR) repeat protein